MKKNVMNIGIANNSLIQQDTVCSTQTHSSGLTMNEFIDFIASLEKEVLSIGEKNDEIEQIKNDIQAIKIQSQAPTPKKGIIRECLLSIKTIAEGAAGNLLGSGLQGKLALFIPMFGG